MSQDRHNLFGLKCEDMDSFLLFYSSSNKILHKLKKSKTITVTYDVFLKSYFAKVVQTLELQYEVKKLLKGGQESYGAILEMIAADFNAQSTNEVMRNKAKSTGTLRQVGKYPILKLNLGRLRLQGKNHCFPKQHESVVTFPLLHPV